MHSVLKQNRILFLGGAYIHIPFIKEIKRQGYYLITCDYSPKNPGHKFSDEYYNVSTADIQGVLNLARKLKPDFIVTYASDLSTRTASYVSEQLGLPGNNFNTIKTFLEKDLFRSFLLKNGFNTPKVKSIVEGAIEQEMLNDFKFPVILKPIDSSGSRGVSKIKDHTELYDAAVKAFSYSRNKRIIVEEMINSGGEQLHGDGFVENGRLIFSFLGDHHYNTNINAFVPFSTTWPSKKPQEIVNKVEVEVNNVIQKSGFQSGPINIEARVDKEDKIFIMEIGPRSGGNFVPQVIKYATGFDMVKASLDVLSGKKIIVPVNNRLFSAYYVIHSHIDGRLHKLSLMEEISPYIREFHQYIKCGEVVKSFQGANAAIGVLLLTFNNREEMDYIIDNMQSYIDLKVDPI